MDYFVDGVVDVDRGDYVDVEVDVDGVVAAEASFGLVCLSLGAASAFSWWTTVGKSAKPGLF